MQDVTARWCVNDAANYSKKDLHARASGCMQLALIGGKDAMSGAQHMYMMFSWLMLFVTHAGCDS
jgi:hypothetical protein